MAGKILGGISPEMRSAIVRFDSAASIKDYRTAGNLALRFSRSSDIPAKYVASALLGSGSIASSAGDHSFAADLFFRALEINPAADIFDDAVMGLLSAVRGDEAVRNSVSKRFLSVMGRTNFEILPPDSLRHAYFLVSNLDIELDSRILAMGKRAFDSAVDPYYKAILGQDLLFRCRVFSRNRGTQFGEAELLGYFNSFIDHDKYRELVDGDTLYTIVADLCHFGFYDQAKRVLLVFGQDEKAEIMIRLSRNVRFIVENFESEGKMTEVEEALDEATQTISSYIQEKMPDIFDRSGIFEEELKYFYSEIRFYSLRANSIPAKDMTYTAVGEDDLILAERARAHSHLSSLLDNLVSRSLRLFDDDFFVKGVFRAGVSILNGEGPRRYPSEEGRSTLFFRLPGRSVYVAVNVNKSDGPSGRVHMVFEMEKKGNILRAPKFDPEAQIYHKILFIRGVLLVLRAVASEYKRTMITNGAFSILSEMDRAVEKANIELLRERRNREIAESIILFCRESRRREEGYVLIENSVIQAFFDASAVYDRFAGSFEIPRLTYTLSEEDALFGFVDTISLNKKSADIYEAEVKYSQSRRGDKSVVLIVDLAKEKVAFRDASLVEPGASLSLGIVENFLVSLSLQVISRFLSLRIVEISKEGYGGYTVDLTGDGIFVVPNSSGAPFDFAKVFDLGFDTLLRTKGILSLDIFERRGKVFSPVRALNEKEKERMVLTMGASALFVSRQKRGIIQRLPVGKIRDERGGLVLGAYKPSDEAKEQKERLKDERLLPQQQGVYIVTEFENGVIHLLPLSFKDSEEELLALDEEGKDFIDRLNEAVLSGRYKDPEVLLKGATPEKRRILSPLISSGRFNQRIATFDVFYTYRRPDFISVSDLLAKGYPLRPPK